jgi:hypothetical protein
MPSNGKNFPVLTKREDFQPLWLNSHCYPLLRIQLRSPCLSRITFLIDIITRRYLLLCRTCNDVRPIPFVEFNLMEDTALYNSVYVIWPTNSRVCNVFVTCHYHQRVSIAVVTILRVTYRNIKNPYNLSRSISEPLDVTNMSFLWF